MVRGMQEVVVGKERSINREGHVEASHYLSELGGGKQGDSAVGHHVVLCHCSDVSQ